MGDLGQMFNLMAQKYRKVGRADSRNEKRRWKHECISHQLRQFFFEVSGHSF